MAPGLNLSLLAGEVEDHRPSTIPTKQLKATYEASSHGIQVVDPSLITADFDLLRFHAAAQGQLETNQDKTAEGDAHGRDNAQKLSSSLVSSPYNSDGHYLDLKDLDKPNLIFAKALTGLKPVREDYATAPYLEALNFEGVLDIMRALTEEEDYDWKEQSFYVVIFRSKLKDDIDPELLFTLDYESHREACESGGLLKYWFGAVDTERRNLATCFWRSRDDARKGGLGPWHRKARAAGRELYESIVFSTHRLTILDDAHDFKFEEWV